tara:strand:+ start:223 stop:792 length:570 start_codon:yes stop_codon:yes gene_type:complete
MRESIPFGKLIVITGPSGVGKGSLVKKLLARNKDIWLSVSATTRAPREGEIEGKDYFFMEKDYFQKLLENNGFLEWAEFAGNSYGTPLNKVKEKLEVGRPVLLEIELEGARQIRKRYQNALMIFLAPPSFEELENRIRGRATDSEEAITKRLSRAKEELKYINEFDETLVNQELDKAVLDFEKIIETYS